MLLRMYVAQPLKALAREIEKIDEKQKGACIRCNVYSSNDKNHRHWVHIRTILSIMVKLASAYSYHTKYVTLVRNYHTQRFK